MLHPKMRQIFIGADVHKRTHTAVIINCFAEKLGEIRFENNKRGFEEFLEYAKQHVKRGQTAVYGLEDTSSNGRNFARFLLERGCKVKTVDPSHTVSERKSQPIAHKTDSYDGFCVARVLLTKLDELPDAVMDDETFTLGILVSRRTALVKSRAALKNQLHSQLIHHYPSYRLFFTNTYCKSAMSFWKQFPSPIALKDVTANDLGDFLYEESSGFFSVKQAVKILALVEKDGDTWAQFQETRDFIVSHCIDEITHLENEVERIDKAIGTILKEFPYKLETMPGIETVTAAMIISEIGNIKRFASADKLSRYAGVSPVSYSSGDKDKRFRNRQGNRQLYEVLRSVAARSVSSGRNKATPYNAIFLDYYRKKLNQGKTKHQAIICVMRQLVNIIYSMMVHNREYIKPSSKIS